MFDVAYLAEVDAYFLESELLSSDWRFILDNWPRYSWVLRMNTTVKILISTHGGY